MGIHYDYKSKRGERAMLKEAKRKERLALKRAKRASSSNQSEIVEEEVKMHDINKPITLDDLTNPDKQFSMSLLSKQDDNKKQKLADALKENLKKRKEFKKKLEKKQRKIK